MKLLRAHMHICSQVWMSHVGQASHVSVYPLLCTCLHIHRFVHQQCGKGHLTGFPGALGFFSFSSPSPPLLLFLFLGFDLALGSPESLPPSSSSSSASNLSAHAQHNHDGLDFDQITPGFDFDQIMPGLDCDKQRQVCGYRSHAR